MLYDHIASVSHHMTSVSHHIVSVWHHMASVSHHPVILRDNIVILSLNMGLFMRGTVFHRTQFGVLNRKRSIKWQKMKQSVSARSS